MVGVKGFARPKDTKSDMNKLAHGRTDDLHFVLAVARQTVTEVADNRVVLLGYNGWEK